MHEDSIAQNMNDRIKIMKTQATVLIHQWRFPSDFYCRLDGAERHPACMHG